MSLLRSPTVVKLFRYSTASVVGVCVGTPVLAVLYAATGYAILSNLVSVTCGAIPNYLINRRWTWHQTGKNRLWGEVVPFWAMSVLGMIASIVAVAYADSRWGTTLAVTAANLTGFGLVWVAKFLVLDRIMWKVVHKIEPDVAIDEAEAGLVGALSLDGTDGEPPLPEAETREVAAAEASRRFDD
jgi:putative flippase GtrA